MKVKDLIAALQNVDPEREVILQKDAEGNGYSPCAGIDDNCTYEAESTWSGVVYCQKLTPELIARGFTDEDTYESGVPALVLAPIN